MNDLIANLLRSERASLERNLETCRGHLQESETYTARLKADIERIERYIGAIDEMPWQNPLPKVQMPTYEVPPESKQEGALP